MRPSNWNAAHIGLDDSESEPTVAQDILAGHSAVLIGLPLILDSGILVTLEAGSVLVLQP